MYMSLFARGAEAMRRAAIRDLQRKISDTNQKIEELTTQKKIMIHLQKKQQRQLMIWKMLQEAWRLQKNNQEKVMKDIKPIRFQAQQGEMNYLFLLLEII